MMDMRIFIPLKKWEPSYGRKEYEIKWHFNLEDIPISEENDDN